MEKCFIRDCEAFIKEAGFPYTVVSKKTGINYSRLRNLRSETVEPTISEFVNLGRFCKLNLNDYLFPTGEPEKSA